MNNIAYKINGTDQTAPLQGDAMNPKNIRNGPLVKNVRFCMYIHDFTQLSELPRPWSDKTLKR